MNKPMRPSYKVQYFKSFEILAILFFSFSLANCTHVTTPSNFRSPSGEKEDRDVEASLTEFRNCELTQKRFPTLFGDDKVECTENYLLFESSKKNSKKISNLKIGTFNVIRIGQSQSKFKKNDLVAKIMNQWDIVNVVEIMTSNRQLLEHNASIDAIADESGVRNKDVENSYDLPKHLDILKSLRKLDPSWSLIMASTGAGELAAQFEYSGFYYRNGAVQNVKSSFCGDKRGCLTPVDMSTYGNLVSRLPFVSRFKAGKFEFTAAGTHARFRIPAPDCAVTGGKPGGKGDDRCFEYSRAEQKIVADYLKLVGKKKFNAEDARYLELQIAYNILGQSEEPILFMGDYNLEVKPAAMKLWSFALGHENVFNTEKSTVSAKNGLVNQYDHFIYLPENFKNCDPASAHSYSFLVDIDNPKTDDPALKEVADFFKERKDTKKALASFKSTLDELEKVESCSVKSCKTTSRYSNEETATLLCLYEKKVLGNFKLKCREEDGDDKEEKEAGPFMVFHEILSDHIPAYMECSTN